MKTLAKKVAFTPEETSAILSAAHSTWEYIASDAYALGPVNFSGKVELTADRITSIGKLDPKIADKFFKLDFSAMKALLKKGGF